MKIYNPVLKFEFLYSKNIRVLTELHENICKLGKRISEKKFPQKWSPHARFLQLGVSGVVGRDQSINIKKLFNIPR